MMHLRRIQFQFSKAVSFQWGSLNAPDHGAMLSEAIGSTQDETQAQSKQLDQNI